MSNELYTRAEIECMTDNALDELLSYYQDKGNSEGVSRVADELAAREDDRLAEQEHQAAEDEAQRRHDEWLNETLIEDGRYG